MDARRRAALQWALEHCDLMQLRELYGFVLLGLPASLVQLRCFCFVTQAAGTVQARRQVSQIRDLYLRFPLLFSLLSL